MSFARKFLPNLVSAIVLVTLSACGGGGSSDNNDPPENPDPENPDPQNPPVDCDTRTFYNDVAGAPAIYFNGQIPVSKQRPGTSLAGPITFDSVYTYDFTARTITVNRTTSPTASSSRNTVYALDESGRPLTRTQRIRNPAIQLDDTTEIRYSYANDGLVSSYSTHSVENGVAEEPGVETTLTWTDATGISNLVTPDRTYSYVYDCLKLVSFNEVLSANGLESDFTVTTTGSGLAVTVAATREGQSSPDWTLVFDDNGNMAQDSLAVTNHEPTTEQVINVELFENALQPGAGLF